MAQVRKFQGDVLRPSVPESKFAAHMDVQSTVRYDHGIEIKLHRMLDELSSRENVSRLNGVRQISILEAIKDGTLAKHRNEFATTPKCCAIRLKLTYDYIYGPVKYVAVDVFSPTGVTIGDLIDVARMINEQADGNIYASDRSIIASLGWK
jgi:hypothetical protein